MVGITGFGAYIPRLRLQRAAVVEANKWANPGIAALAKGERSMANWDEDSVTLAVEAARDCLAGADALFFAAVAQDFAGFSRRRHGLVEVRRWPVRRLRPYSPGF